MTAGLPKSGCFSLWDMRPKAFLFSDLVWARHKRGLRKMHKYTKEELIDAAKRADKKAEGSLSRSEFIRITGIREWQIENMFPQGGWSELKRLAKMNGHPVRFKALPGKKTINGRKDVAQETILTGIDRWDLKVSKPKQRIAPPPISDPAQSKKDVKQGDNMEIAEFGELIDFRGLRHAPINENGVIYLFGMVSQELVFLVEAFYAAFPDCEAKKHIGENRFQRVRIKFEYQSSNYNTHRQDPAGSDMIVCWHHDWSDCPLEVLELRSEIDKLQ